MADPTAGQIGWAELDVPWGHTGDLSYAELQVPFVPAAGEVSWAEVSTPLVAAAGRISWAELKVPAFPTAGEVSWAELAINQTPTAGRIGVAYVTFPPAASAGQLSQAFFQVPKSYADSFALSNGSVDIFRSANLSAIQSAGQITHVDVTSSGVYYTQANDIVITAQHSTNNVLSEDAVLAPVIGAQTTKAGTYRTTKGFLSSDKFLQDETFYNDHTYAVKVAESFDRWATIYKKTLHPAGFNLVGLFVDVMTPPAFTMTAEDADVTIV